MATSANYQLGVSQAGTLNIVVPKPYSDWASGYALTTTAAQTSQHDAVPNLLKYLYDINPTQPMSASDRSALPVAGIDTTSTPGTSYLMLTYRENNGMFGIGVTVQT